MRVRLGGKSAPLSEFGWWCYCSSPRFSLPLCVCTGAHAMYTLQPPCDSYDPLPAFGRVAQQRSPPVLTPRHKQPSVTGNKSSHYKAHIRVDASAVCLWCYRLPCIFQPTCQTQGPGAKSKVIIEPLQIHFGCWYTLAFVTYSNRLKHVKSRVVQIPVLVLLVLETLALLLILIESYCRSRHTITVLQV